MSQVLPFLFFSLTLYCCRGLMYPGTDAVILCFPCERGQVRWHSGTIDDKLATIRNHVRPIPSFVSSLTHLLLLQWFPELQHYIPKVPIYLVCTKVDLRETSDAATLYTPEEIAKVVEDVQPRLYLESSAKTGAGVDVLATMNCYGINTYYYSPRNSSHKP